MENNMDPQQQNDTLQVAQQAFERHQTANNEATSRTAERECQLATQLAQAEALERIADSLETIAQCLEEQANDDDEAHPADLAYFGAL